MADLLFIYLLLIFIILQNKFCFRHFEMEMFVRHSGREEKKFKERNSSGHVNYVLVSMPLKPERKAQPVVSSLYPIGVKVLKTTAECMVKEKAPAKPRTPFCILRTGRKRSSNK